MIKVICIGHASYDMYVKVDEFPKENDKLSLWWWSCF